MISNHAVSNAQFALSVRPLKQSLTVLLFACLGGCGQPLPEAAQQVWPTEQRTDVALSEPTLPVLPMTEYADPDAGFVARVPVGWRRVNLREEGDSGFSVSFESPASTESDQFSDYLLIEILPDTPTPAFGTAPTERVTMLVAGQRVYRERFELPDYSVSQARLDLVAWQVVYREPGYSVGVYVVGERREDARLERLIIEFAHSLRVENAPFTLT